MNPQNLAAVGKVLQNLPQIQNLDKLPSFNTMAKIMRYVIGAVERDFGVYEERFG